MDAVERWYENSFNFLVVRVLSLCFLVRICHLCHRYITTETTAMDCVSHCSPVSVYMNTGSQSHLQALAEPLGPGTWQLLLLLLSLLLLLLLLLFTLPQSSLKCTTTEQTGCLQQVWYIQTEPASNDLFCSFIIFFKKNCPNFWMGITMIHGDVHLSHNSWLFD